MLPNALSAHSLSSSNKSEFFQQVGHWLCNGMKRKFVPLCSAVDSNSGLTSSCRKKISTSSRVFLSGEIMVLNVCNASFGNCAWKWLFFAFVISGCISSIVWYRFSKISFFFPIYHQKLLCLWIQGSAMVLFLVVVMLQVRQLYHPEDWRNCLGLNSDFLVYVQALVRKFSCDTCFDKFQFQCDAGLRGVRLRPVRHSGVLLRLGCLFCHHVMKLWLPIKKCSWDRYLTYLIRKTVSDLIIPIKHLQCFIPSGYVLT